MSLFAANPNPELTLSKTQQTAIIGLIPVHPDGDPIQFGYASTVDGRTAFIASCSGIIHATGVIAESGQVVSYSPRNKRYPRPTA